ncbi:Permease of the drug/metabolite transporter (DMT) superfamily [Rhodococcus triatomae]|uniref:Permease of the drug/metabolite transporter (DMT) superfamily n=1 Tax=Rhodococcus triatomae TaxID=300028 RepID=A0A1G8CM04_9NOCA|nr:Permease of the drug/metabolite transporter (DMT) superfamily [Rhodococcus triatomae]
MTGPSRARVSLPLQYAGAALAWGSSFLFVSIGLGGMSPTQVVLGRLLLGAATLALVLLARRNALPRDPMVWWHMTVLAVTQCLLPWLLFSWAQQSISSGLASIYNATTPLMTMAVALAFLPGERSTPGKIAGLLLGFGGVVVVLAPWSVEWGGSISAQVACLGATASYGVALVYLRRFVLVRGVGAPTVAFLQTAIAAGILLSAAPAVAATPVHLTPAVAAAILALGVVGSGLAFVWNTNVVRGWGPTAASTVTYLTPIVGVALGATVLGERISWNQPAGATVVIAGILLTRRASPDIRRASRGKSEGPLPLGVTVPAPQPHGVATNLGAIDQSEGLGQVGGGQPAAEGHVWSPLPGSDVSGNVEVGRGEIPYLPVQGEETATGNHRAGQRHVPAAEQQKSAQRHGEVCRAERADE